MNTVSDAINAELAKQGMPVSTPAVVEEKPIEENKPIIKQPESKPVVAPEVKPESKPEEKDDFKPVELDKKFKTVSYERFKDINEKYKALKAEKEDKMKNIKAPTFENDEEKEMHNNFKKMGFVTKDEADLSSIQAREEQIRQEEQMVFDKEVRKLETEFDGTDGLPAFKKEEVVKWGIENQVFDPKSAYIVMNLQTIINHFVKQGLTEAKKLPVFGKNNEVKQPDIAPKGKLNTAD